MVVDVRVLAHASYICLAVFVFLSLSLFKSHFGGVGGRLAETSCDARARRRLRKWGCCRNLRRLSRQDAYFLGPHPDGSWNRR